MNAKNRPSLPASRLQRILGRSSLAASISVALGMVGQAWAAPPGIVIDRRTETDIESVQAPNQPPLDDGTPRGKRTGFDIISGTTKNGTDFNSFKDFVLADGETVNFLLSSTAKNVVNLVWNSRDGTIIDGTINSYLSNGNIGGNVFFADPHGIVVGATGKLNVGSLSLSAPSRAFMNSLLDGSGALDLEGDAMKDLLLGKEVLAKSDNGDCVICVSGMINANNAVRIRATAIDVDGSIMTSGTGDDILATAVNVEGSATPLIINDGNTIRLIAEDSGETGTLDASAKASISVSGNLKTGTATVAQDDPRAATWGDVEARASATAKSQYKDILAPIQQFKEVTSLLKDQEDFSLRGFASTQVDSSLTGGLVSGQMAYVTASAIADVDVSGNINAAGNVDLATKTTSEASTSALSAAAQDNAAALMVTGMYGAIFSHAKTTVGGQITGKQVSATSRTDNLLDITAATRAQDSTQTMVATTVAWSQAAVDATTSVSGVINAATALKIDARNTGSFSTTAAASTPVSGGGSVGLAGAVSLQTVKANASLSGGTTTAPQTIGAGGATITADSTLTKNVTTATVSATLAPPGGTTTQTGGGGTPANFTGVLANKSGTATAGQGGSYQLPFKVGGAVSWTDSSIGASATVADNANIRTAGDVAIHAQVKDKGIHGGASSTTPSKATDNAGSEFNLSAAVNYGNYSHDANAEVGKAANIVARNIGVGANVLVPFDWTFGFGFVSAEDASHTLKWLGQVGKNLASIPGANNPLSKNATGTASASASGAPVDIGGSVNYVSMENSSRAWVGDGAQLTVSADPNPDGTDSWATLLPGGANIDWLHSIAITAHTNANAFNMVGDPRLWNQATSGDAAIGGAFNYLGASNTTIAGIGSGAKVIADASKKNEVQVSAVAKDTFVSFSPISGKGGTAALQGTVAITDVKDITHATVSAAADISAHALTLHAQNPLMIWALSGAVAMSDKASIGISIGINNAKTDTVASIGDNSSDDAAPADPAAAPTQTGGKIKVAKLDVLATSEGEVGGVSVAGSAVTAASSGGAQKPDANAGSGLVDLLKNVTSTSKDLQTKLASVDTLSGALTGGGSGGGSGGSGTSMLGNASKYLGELSSATSALGTVVDKASSLGQKGGGSAPTGATSTSGSFGIAVSGAASVNMASLGSRAELSGANIDNGSQGTRVTVQAINRAQLASAAGAAALSLAKGGSGGDLGGAVAYSSVENNTTAGIADSTLSNAPQVVVHALDGSEQTGIGVGAAVNTGGGNSTTLAGSVSVARSNNATQASISNSSLDGGQIPASGTDNRVLDVTAYDHSRIGVGAGAFSVATGGNNTGAALGLTYSDIGNTTLAKVSGRDADGFGSLIRNYRTFGLRALDASLIGAGVLSGKISAGNSGNGLSGAFIWNQVANDTVVTVDDDATIAVAGDMQLTAASVTEADAGIASLNAAIGNAGSLSGYDFGGNSLAYTGAANDLSGDTTDQPGQSALQDTGWGSSIIAVAGDVAVGGNNVGLSFVGSQVKNAHRVDIGNATLSAGENLMLNARDNTRIIDLAAGVGISTGQFAGMGSAVYNDIANASQVRFGSAVLEGKSASISANNVFAKAEDASRIYGLAGNVAISTGSAAAAGAVAYNKIANTVTAEAGRTAFRTDGNVELGAKNDAQIMAGAVAGGGSMSGTALGLSFGWNETGNQTFAGARDGSTFDATGLIVDADNASRIYALAGSVGIGGKAAVGLAATVATIQDDAEARLDDVALNVSDSVQANAAASGKIYSLSVAGSVGEKGSGSGSLTYNTIDNDVKASASRLHGLDAAGVADAALAAHAGSLQVGAGNGAAISSLAGALGIGTVGIGIAATVADIGGTTSATLSDSVLDITNATKVIGESDATIRTLAVGGAGGAGAVAGSSSTNQIDNDIRAGISNVGTDPAKDGSGEAKPGVVLSQNVTTIAANNNARIDSLAGAAGYGGNAAGAAIAVNRIATTNQAYFSGGSDQRGYRVRQLTVDAGSTGSAAGQSSGQGGEANINTIAVGAAMSSGMTLAGSLAVNIMSGGNDARIDKDANVIADGSIGVFAGNHQGINVLAGAASLRGSAGVGIGVVVNDVQTDTTAGIYGSKVTAYGNDVVPGGAGMPDEGGLMVDSGTAKNASILDDQMKVGEAEQARDDLANPSDYTSPDLSSEQLRVHGLAVNANNQQHIATMGVGAAVADTVAIGAIVGVNRIGGKTEATIDGSAINQGNYGSTDISSGSGTNTASGFHGQTPNQQVDVRAGSRQFAVNWVAGGAASSTAAAAGAAAVNVFDAETSATIRNGSDVKSTLATTIAAHGAQWSLASAVGLAGSLSAFGGAGSAGVNLFKSATHAGIDGSKLTAGDIDVLSSSHAAGGFIGGALGLSIQGGGIAGVALVNVDASHTTATILDSETVSTINQKTVSIKNEQGEETSREQKTISGGAQKVRATHSNLSQARAGGAGVGQVAGIAGAAVVNVMGDRTHAGILGSDVIAASGVTVSAYDKQAVDVATGVLGAGALGLGGGLNLSLLQSDVGAQIDSSAVSAHGDVKVEATSDRVVNSQAVAIAGGVVSLGGSVGVLMAGSGDITDDAGSSLVSGKNQDGSKAQLDKESLSSLASENRFQMETKDGNQQSTLANAYGLDDSQLSATELSSLNAAAAYNLDGATGGGTSFGQADGIQAGVTGSQITTSGKVALNAVVSNDTRNIAGSYPVGGIAMGGAVAYSAINTDTRALIDSGSQVIANSGVDVSAVANNGQGDRVAAETQANIGFGGLVGVGAAVAISHIDSKVSATSAGNVSGGNGAGNLTISAADHSSAKAGNSNPSVVVGGIAVGAVVVKAERKSDVTAKIADAAQAKNFAKVVLSALNDGSLAATGVMGAGGVGAAGIGVNAKAKDASSVAALIGAGANIKASDTMVSAISSPVAESEAKGIGFSGVETIGVNIATTDVATTVRAEVGDNAVFEGGSLAVKANATPTSASNATGGAGSLAIAINAAESTATNNSTVTASIGNGVTLPDGDLDVVSSAMTRQTANASGIAGAGLIAAGNVKSTATSNVTRSARLGDGTGSVQRLGKVQISATGTDTNNAASTAGSGALFGGNGSQAATGSTSTTTASIGKQQKLVANNFGLLADHKTVYGGKSDSFNVALLGGAGAQVDNKATSTTNAVIGEDTAIVSGGDILVHAQSAFASDDSNEGATGGSGGVFTGASAKVATALAAKNTTTLGENVVLMAGLNTPANQSASLDIIADTITDALNDQASQTVKGAVPVAVAEAKITGDFTSDVGIGNSSQLSSSGRVNVATYAGIDNMGAQALANTGGVSTIGTAKSEINLNSNQSVTIGDNVDIFSAGEADIVAGRDIKNIQATRFNPTANAQAYVRGLIAIPYASAKATVNSNAHLTMGSGSKLTSGGDVAIGSMIGQSTLHVDGTGHGYELGFIPVTKTNNSSQSTGSATTTIDGDVLAGRFNKVDISIDANGDIHDNVTDPDTAAPITVMRVDADPTSYLTDLGIENTKPDGFDTQVVPIYHFGGTAVGAPITVAGGNVYLYGRSVSGNGSLKANGAPSVTINNASEGYLFLPTITAKFGSTGQVLVSGGADPAHLGNIQVSQAPSDAVPAITINSNYPVGNGKSPGIAVLGDINNLGGTVDITSLAGSFAQFGGMYANAVTLNIPSGVVTIDGSGKDIFAGNDPASALSRDSWLWGLLNGPTSSPDAAAAVIAQYVFSNDLDPNANAHGSLVRLNRMLLMNTWNWDLLAGSGLVVPGERTIKIENPDYDPTKAGLQCQFLDIGPTCKYLGYQGNPDANFPTTDSTPVILYGNCAAYRNEGADGCYALSDTGIFNESFIPSDAGRYAAIVPYMHLWQAGTMPAPSEASSWRANQLKVKANTINVNAPIYVGTPATWTVHMTDALKTWISNHANGANAIAIPATDDEGKALLTLVDVQGNSQRIGAKYDPVNNRIILDDVNAAGNGSAVFDGRIVSTGGGSVHVSSGYGSVTVQNDSGTALVTRNIYAGSGGRGSIELIDRQQADGSGNPLRTWYISDNGEPAKIYSNESDQSITSFDGLVASGVVTDATVYQPKAGMQYVWSASIDVSRGTDAANPWSWSSPSGGTAGLHWTTPRGSYRYRPDGAIDEASGTAPTHLGSNDYAAMLSGEFTNYTSQVVHYHDCDKDGYCNYGTMQTSDGKPPGNDGDSKPHSLWRYIYPLDGRLTLTVVHKADKPIAINFDTSQANHVTIGSNADVYLTGLVSNTHGPTYINTSNGGNIIQGNDKALLWTHELSMSARGGGSIGEAGNPILAKIAHDGEQVSDKVPVALPTNVLMASTEGGSINVNVDSGSSDQAILAVASDGAGKYGDININGTGSLVGLDGDGRALIGAAQPISPFDGNARIYRAPALNLVEAVKAGRDLVGRSMSLQSKFGSIGNSTAALQIETHPDAIYNGGQSGGVLNAHAYSDISIVAHGGDIWAGGYATDSDGNWRSGIVSGHGDVTLSAPDGGIYDARLLLSSSTLTPEQAREIWNKLHLTDGKAMDGVIAGIGRQVENAYSQYWQLRASGTITAGSYWLNDAAVPVYFRLAALKDGIDPASVTDLGQQKAMAQAFASERYAEIASTFQTYVGNDWQQRAEFNTKETGYQFVLDPAGRIYQDLMADSTWTENQLKYAINVTALAVPTGGQVGSAPANVSGREVSLTAGRGGIGRSVEPMLIKYTDLFNGDLTQAQANALAMAHSPGDAILKDALDGTGNIIDPTDSRLDPDSSHYDPNLLQSILLRQTNPLYVDASDKLSGSASDSVYLQSSGDLHLDGLNAGNDMRLAAGGSIDAADGRDSHAPVLIAGGDVTLAAGNGHVSFGNGVDDALPVQIGGALLSGSANTNLILRQVAGDLRLGTAFANGLVSLSAPTGSILATLDGLSILAKDIMLEASGDIGRRALATTGVDAPLRVQVGDDGLINAIAGGAINIDSPQFALHIGTLQAGADLSVSASKSGMDAERLASTGGSVRATANGDAAIGTVEALSGVDIATTGALASGVIASASGDVTLNAVTGMALGAVDAGTGSVTANVSGSDAPLLSVGDHVTALKDISLISSGAMQMASGSQVSAGQQATLSSKGDMVLGSVMGGATHGNAIDITSGGSITSNGAVVNLQARQGGSTFLEAEKDIGTGDAPLVVDVASLTGGSKAGDVWLHAMGDIHIPRLSADMGSMWLWGEQAASFDMLEALGSLTLEAAMISGDSALAGDIAMQSATSINLETAKAGNTLNLDAGTDLTAQTLQSGGDMTLAAGGLANIATAEVGKALSLTAADAVLGQATVGGTSTITVDNDLRIDTLAGGDTLTAQAGHDATLGTVVLSAGDANVEAGESLTVNSLTAQSGNVALGSGTAMALGEVSASGALAATAGTDLTAQTLQSGGDMTLAAGGLANIATAEVGKALSLTAADAVLGQATVGGTSTITVDNDLRIDTLAGGDTLTAQAGHDATLGTVVLSAGDANVEAGESLTVNSLTAQSGNVALGSGTAMALGEVSASGALAATAGTDLTAQTLQSGGDMTLAAAGAMTLSSANAGGDITATAGDALRFAALQSGADITASSAHAGITGDSATSAGSLELSAATDVAAESLQSGIDTRILAGGTVDTQTINAGRDAFVRAGGDVDMYSTRAGRTIDVDSGGALTMNDATAGHSILLAAEQMTFSDAQAPDLISLLARNGDITAARLATRDAYVAANGDISLAAGEIGNRINLQGNNIEATLKQTSAGQPLYSVLTGYRDGVAKNIVVTLDAPEQWEIDRLSAVFAQLGTTAAKVDIESGHIERKMALDTAEAKIRMDQQEAYLVEADVQLMQPTFDFLLRQDGIHHFGDAYVIRYGFGNQIEVPNYLSSHIWKAPDYLGESALRYNGRRLQEHTDFYKDAFGRTIFPNWMFWADDELVTPAPEGAVNLHSKN